jgi:hypothetical protein
MRDYETSPTQPQDVNELLNRIQKAFDKWDDAAIKGQKKARQLIAISVLLIPLAVFLLTIQILAFPKAGFISVALISMELIVLFTALLFLLFNPMNKRRKWTEDRMRAEILRREKLLLSGKLGPYLDKDSFDELDAAVDMRLAMIDNPANKPERFLPLRNIRPWRDELEDARGGKMATPEKGFAEMYLNNRIADQQKWFKSKSKKLIAVHFQYENIIRLTIAIALVLAAMHLMTLLFNILTEGSARNMKLIIEILAITVPPIGSAAAALQGLFQYLRVGRSYKMYARELGKIHEDFAGLICSHKEKLDAFDQLAESEEKKKHIKQEISDYEFQIKRIVLRCEGILSNELNIWYSVIRPGQP